MPKGEITPSTKAAFAIFFGKQMDGGDRNSLQFVRESVQRAFEMEIHGTATIEKKRVPANQRSVDAPSTFVINASSQELLDFIMADVQAALLRIDNKLIREAESLRMMPPVSHQPPYMPQIAAGGGGGGGGISVFVPRPGSLAHTVEPAPRPPPRPERPVQEFSSLSSASVVSEEEGQSLLTLQHKLQIANAKAAFASIDAHKELYLEALMDQSTPEEVLVEIRSALIEGVRRIEVLLLKPRTVVPSQTQSPLPHSLAPPHSLALAPPPELAPPHSLALAPPPELAPPPGLGLPLPFAPVRLLMPHRVGNQHNPEE